MFLKILQYSQKRLGLESLLKKVAGPEARKYIKSRLQDRCFPVNIAKFLRTAFYIEQLWWLLLELRHFFSLWYITLKLMRIVWHRHNLMISLSVDSATLVSIHVRTTWGTLNVIASLIWFLFLKKRFPFSHMLPIFQDNFILVETTSSHFFRVTVSR